MITDAVYKIGSSHRVCQDYALATPSSVILCDGCSSGRHVDIGAKIVAHFHQGSHLITVDNNNGDGDRFRHIASLLRLEQEDMCATMLRLSDVTPQGYQFTRAGDGFLFRKYDDSLVIYQYEYKQNAPYYICYDYFGTKSTWENQFRNNNLITTKWEFNDKFEFVCKTVTDESMVNNGLAYTWASGSTRRFEYVGVASDGLSSFQDSNKNPIELDRIVPILFNYKNFNPGFLQRRVQMAEKEFAKLGWSHYDDLSMGVIANEKPV